MEFKIQIKKGTCLSALFDYVRKEDFMKIGVDIGGSHIGVGLIEDKNILAIKDKILTREDRVNIEKTIVNEITSMVKELCQENSIKDDELELIGIASPGTISNGKIVQAGNLGIINFDLLGELKKEFKCRIIVRKD